MYVCIYIYISRSNETAVCRFHIKRIFYYILFYDSAKFFILPVDCSAVNIVGKLPYAIYRLHYNL